MKIILDDDATQDQVIELVQTHVEFIQTYFDGLCHVCFEESFFPVCCDCLQRGIEEHRKELHGCV